jgi:hypothetical protein
MLEVQPGIDLGGGDVGVPEHLLHGAQVLRGLQDVAGEAVAQHVRMHVGGHAGRLRDARQLQLHHARRDAAPARAQEQGGGVFRPRGERRQLRARRDPFAQGLHGRVADGHGPALAALAQHHDLGFVQVQPAARLVVLGALIAQVQPDQFRQPQAAGIQQFEHGLVAQRRGFGRHLRRGAVQQGLGLFHR